MGRFGGWCRELLERRRGGGGGRTGEGFDEQIPPPPPDLPVLEFLVGATAQVFRVNPSTDVVVVSLARKLRADQAELVRDAVAQELPAEVPVLILDGGLELSVIRVTSTAIGEDERGDT